MTFNAQNKIFLVEFFGNLGPLCRSKNCDLYDPGHGGRVLAMAPGLDQIKIIKFRAAAYDKTLQRMAYYDPQRPQDFEHISGTKMRELARKNQRPPRAFMGDKAWNVLAQYYQVNGELPAK